jgi:hypothetical protein
VLRYSIHFSDSGQGSHVEVPTGISTFAAADMVIVVEATVVASTFAASPVDTFLDGSRDPSSFSSYRCGCAALRIHFSLMLIRAGFQRTDSSKHRTLRFSPNLAKTHPEADHQRNTTCLSI